VNFADLFIQRPILTWMLTLGLIVFGVLGYNRLGIDQFPTIDLPELTVIATLEGATPEGMEEDVTDVIEEQLNTIAGVQSITSKTLPGQTRITVQFALGTDLDIAAQDVRDKIALARALLPKEMDPPTVGKFNINEQPILWIPLQTDLPLTEASQYVKHELKPIFETIPGVAGVELFGAKERNIRIWLDGDALRARELAVTDIIQAIEREHVEQPAGVVESTRMEYGVKTMAEFRTIDELTRLIVRHDEQGGPIYLGDIARVEDGMQDIRSVERFNGRDTIGLGIRKQSGGNAVAIVNEVYRRLDQVEAILPRGISLDRDAGFIDFSEGVREAVSETKFTLWVGALLAVLTVFIFLRRTRPTLIVAAAIPISLIATFGLVWLAGFTLNTMTLLGMSLAVGVVVDDAIVVLENIERHRERGEPAPIAARKGTQEIAFAATAATFSIAAVFLPVFFVQGIVGSFLGDFGLTVAGSVIISLFVALTLTPMLAARMPPPQERKTGSLYHRLEIGFTWLEDHYQKALAWSLEHRGKTVALALVSLVLTVAAATRLHAEFFPSADEGLFFAKMEAPPGSTVDASLEYLKMDEKWMLSQPEVTTVFSSVGSTGEVGFGSPNQFMMFGALKPRRDRKRGVHEIIQEAREALTKIPGREIRIYNPAESMRGSHVAQFVVDLRGNLPLDELSGITDRFIEMLQQKEGFIDLDKSLKLGLPELQVIPDREKAAALGVDARSIATAVQVMIGGLDVGIFKDAGRRIKIRMRLEAEDRDDPEELERLYVRSKSGEVVDLGNLAHVAYGAAPSTITRTDRQRSVEVSSNLVGKTLADSVADAREVASIVLPASVTLNLAGQAEDMEESFRQFGIAIILGILVIYMILAAQFESLVHPLTVMLALPFAMVGALGGLLAFNQTLNIFSLIGIILLFGLVTKNSILLVDYANQLRREENIDKTTAMLRAAPIRMRPVLMTAISMIFGVLPAAIGLGPGSETRMPMAIATATGMFSSTLLTLLIVPTFYVLFDDFAEKVKAWLPWRRQRGERLPIDSSQPT